MAMGIAFPPVRPRAAQLPARPAVIAHRGASGHRPEHNLAAYELAFRTGADSVELDLLATRDGVLVCRHDLELSRTTDVAARPEFAHLRRTVELDGDVVSGWFVHDFTLQELRQLRARERWPRKRRNSACFDGRYGVPTIAEVLALVERESARLGVRLAVHAELKAVAHQRRQGLDVTELVASLPESARPEVTWFGFEADALRRLDVAGPVLRLFDETPNALSLARVGEYASGIAVRRKAVFPRAADGSVDRPARLVENAHRRGLSVLVWTHRAENQHLPSNFRIGGAAHGHGDAAGEATILYGEGVDGLITDFPEIAAAARAGFMGEPVKLA